MSALLVTTTGMTLLVASGAVSLPKPPSGSQVGGGGGGTPSNWYDVLFARRTGVGIGATAPGGGYMTVAAYVAATPGTSDTGSQITVSNNNVIMADVDLATSPRSVQALAADGLTIDNVVTSVVAGKLAQIDLRDSNHQIRNVTIENPSKTKDVPCVLIGHLTGDTGTHRIDNLYVPLAPGDIKLPNNGVAHLSNITITGAIYQLNQHFDMIDWRGSKSGSYAEDLLFVADVDPTSAPAGNGTGVNNFVRCADGNVATGLRVSRAIWVGSNAAGSNSTMIQYAHGGSSGCIFEDILVDTRNQGLMHSSSFGVDDWHNVRSFSWSQALADGYITPGALIPYPNLATQPAAVPDQMAAPVITAASGGFTYGAMTRPKNRRSQITGYTIEWSTDGTNWTAVAASLDGGAVATGAATNVRARVYATNGVGNGAASPSSNILPVITAGVTQPLSITALPFDGFVFDAQSGSTAYAIIRGKSDSLASVQVRGEGTVNTPWVTTVADGAGDWTATLTLDANAGEWYVPAARLGTNDATRVTSPNTFAGGDVHVFAGQSEVEHILAVAGAYNGNAYPTLLAQNLTMITQANTGSREVRRIATAGVGTVNVAMVALANLFHRARPGRKLLIIDCAVSGVSRSVLHNDANTTMKWSDLQVTIDDIRGAGGEVGHWTECWYNADAATIKTFGTSWAPFYMGQRWGGGAFTVGTANPDDAAGPVDHILWDVESSADAYGRAAFKRSRTKLNLLTPMPFHDTATTEQRNFTHDSTGALLNNRIKNLDRPARDTLDAFAADTRVQTFLGGIGPSAHVVDFGGGIHPLPDDPYGTPQFAMLFAPAVLRGAGYTIHEPVIDHAGVLREASGLYADIPVTLPNGGTLTTLRILRAIAAPSVEPPHYQPVAGFEIRRAADTDAGRRPVMKPTETGYPSAYRGTVTIQDTGSGSGSARRGWVRITPTDPFVAGDRLEYLRGEANGHIVEPRDVTARLFLDMLIEHIPALYYPADTYPFCGVPVRPQPPMMTLA